MTSLHVPLRPIWMCTACGVDWPCVTKRRHLQAEYGRAPVSLSLLMSSYFVDAAVDMPAVPCGQMHARFLGWLPGDQW